MQNRLVKIALVGLMVGNLAACSELFSVTPNHAYSADQACARIKRQMIYNTTNNNTEASWLAPSQHNALRAEYKHHHCG